MLSLHTLTCVCVSMESTLHAHWSTLHAHWSTSHCTLVDITLHTGRHHTAHWSTSHCTLVNITLHTGQHHTHTGQHHTAHWSTSHAHWSTSHCTLVNITRTLVNITQTLEANSVGNCPSLCLSLPSSADTGEVVTSGDNTYGQLGYPKEKGRRQPGLVEALGERGAVKKVACGDCFTVVATEGMLVPVSRPEE